MESEISKIIKSYQRSLNHSRECYENLFRNRGENALDFHRQYSSRLVRQYSVAFNDPANRRRLHRLIKRALGSDTINFVAIDGSCSKDVFSDFVVFAACAYGAKGQIQLDESGDQPAIRYRRWELSRDVSMVAYVPVPFAQLADALGEREDFLVSDQDRINLAVVHTKIMQLAEIYLAYNVVSSSSIDFPRLIMMDLLPSSMMASIAGKPEAVNLMGYHHDRRRLNYEDIVIALSHPYNIELGLPNRNKFRLHQRILAELDLKGESRIDLSELAGKIGVSVRGMIDAAMNRLCQLASPEHPRRVPLGRLEGNVYESSIDVRASWQFCISLFRSICDRLFRHKDPGAMVYQVEGTDRVMREHWLDPNDIEFLIAVGIRALIEACWEKQVLLIGIAKDSSTRYFTRNYMGILCYRLAVPGLVGLEVGRLPWTDRMFFEFIASEDHNLLAPWATVEFDSSFMTLWTTKLPDGQMSLGAPQGFIVAHSRLFQRSLAQFFLDRKKETALMGHVVFVDRLVMQNFDRALPELVLDDQHLGLLRPFGYLDSVIENQGQDIAMYLLSCLTRNHFPEVIGYPDPLHKADWGAKTLGDQLRATIRSSEVAFRARPLARTFRSIRDSHGRR